jgi:hypothetical protein
MPPGRMGERAVGPPVCGAGTDGIGINRLMPILSFRMTGSSSTRSAGVFTRPGVRMRPRTLAMDTAMAVTAMVTVVAVILARATVRHTPPVLAAPDRLDMRTTFVVELSAVLAVAEPSGAAAEVSATVASGEASAMVEVSVAAVSTGVVEEAVSTEVVAEGMAGSLPFTVVTAATSQNLRHLLPRGAPASGDQAHVLRHAAVVVKTD